MTADDIPTLDKVDASEASFVIVDETPALVEQTTRDFQAQVAGLEDADALMFLRARRFEVQPAVKLAQAYLAHPYSSLKIRAAEVEPLLKTGAIEVLPGRDQMGRVVIYTRPALMQDVDVDLVKKAAWFTMHRLLREPETQRRGVTIIENVDGIALDKARHLMHEVAALVQDILPVRIGRVCIVNQPGFFKILWALMRLVLSKPVRDRVVVLGRDHASLPKFVPAETIPSELGGALSLDSLAPWWTATAVKA